MKMRISTPLALAAIAAMALVAGAVRPAAPRPAGPVLVPQAIEAPERAFTPGRPVAAPAACVTPPPVVTSAFIHCYTPAQIRAAYGSVSPGPVAGLPTLTGWDMTTGFGSPKVPAFIGAVRAARNTP